MTERGTKRDKEQLKGKTEKDRKGIERKKIEGIRMKVRQKDTERENKKERDRDREKDREKEWGEAKEKKRQIAKES